MKAITQMSAVRAEVGRHYPVRGTVRMYTITKFEKKKRERNTFQQYPKEVLRYM